MNVYAYLEKIEALSLREKFLVGATICVLIISLSQFFLVDPHLSRHTSLTSQLNNMVANNSRMQLQLEDNSLTPKENRQQVLQSEIAALEAALKLQADQIQEQTVSMVPADQIPDLLQGMLSKQSVALVGLKNLAPKLLLEETADEGGPGSIQLYQHGIELELKGDFHALRRYLLAVESQPWRLLWDSVSFEFVPGGQSLMRLQVKTLSTDDIWLGV